MMKISIDAEACPRVIKDISLRTAERAHDHLALVANQIVSTWPSAWITFLQVVGTLDVAHDEVVARVKPGDLVITAEIPRGRGHRQ